MHRTCLHKNNKHNCEKCSPQNFCKHRFRKDSCPKCSPQLVCEHAKRRWNCAKCSPQLICKHGSVKYTCPICHPFYASSRCDYLKILKSSGLSERTPVRDILNNNKVTNEILENISKGHGYPDWPKEDLEEKKAGDCLESTQWARAILTMRSGGRYRVSFRFSSNRRKIFKDVFDFQDWYKFQHKKWLDKRNKM